jgi:hypothetical protein
VERPICLCGDGEWLSFLFGCLRDADDSPRVPIYNLSNEKVKKLGLHFQPLDEVLRETVAKLKELKYLD